LPAIQTTHGFAKPLDKSRDKGPGTTTARLGRRRVGFIGCRALVKT
jgi:hypothetical protein